MIHQIVMEGTFERVSQRILHSPVRITQDGQVKTPTHPIETGINHGPRGGCHQSPWDSDLAFKNSQNGTPKAIAVKTREISTNRIDGTG